MPQLKKVVLAMGNRMVYRDTYEQALAELTGIAGASTPSPPEAGAAKGTSPPPVSAGADPRLEQIRRHLRRYRELSAQGKWAEAGRELEALEGEVQR